MTLNPPVDGSRALPSNLEAERAVLGAILVHNDALEAVASILAPGQFYRQAHGTIFHAMIRLRDAHSGVDFVTLRAELGRSGDLEDVGGPAYISSLADGVPRATNIQQYARIIAEQAALRDIISVGNTMLTSAFSGEQPPSVILAEADRALLALHGRGASVMQGIADGTPRRFKELEWRVAHKGELRGVTTGYPSLNDLTLGLRAGDLDILAARPSVGKSTLALNMAVHAATAGARVAVFSLEMTREQLEDRILAQLTRVALSRIQSGHIGAADWAPIAEGLEAMHQLAIGIDDRSGQTAQDIRHGCRRLVGEYGRLDLVVVDYVQLMPGTLERRGASRTEELSDTATKLKELAKELAVPVLLLSQLRRVDGRPKIEDLRECGTLEQVADIVMLLHRKDHRVSGTTECNLAKQRNGATGTVNLTIDRDTTTFTDGGEALPEPTHEEQQATTKRTRQKSFARRFAHVEA